MCRSAAHGARRCPSTPTRAVAAARKALTRARRAHQQAQHTGDPDAITTTARRLTDAHTRLDTARTQHHQASTAGGQDTPTQPAPDNPDTTAPGSHTTDDRIRHTTAGDFSGVQAGHSTGPITTTGSNPAAGHVWIGGHRVTPDTTAAQPRDRTPTRPRPAEQHPAPTTGATAGATTGATAGADSSGRVEVTNTAHGHTTGIQADEITGGITLGPGGRIRIGNRRAR